ncbi:hypothetical protein CEQ21_07130 (plasmid) [Niallia circulans]|uniref:Uncharacterized protein n=1 Tax=Niallia circulans TaxID=1397 RepID=A0A553SQS6_NIACI|nr:hypothetical protein [Niallia circulans]TRZ39326.1 hypothetical protein CEQ21_07130 [Niallia circulans]
MKLEVEHNFKRITFISKEANIYGYTEYTSKLWSKIKDLNWYISDKDLENGERTYIKTGSGKA